MKNLKEKKIEVIKIEFIEEKKQTKGKVYHVLEYTYSDLTKDKNYVFPMKDKKGFYRTIKKEKIYY